MDQNLDGEMWCNVIYSRLFLTPPSGMLQCMILPNDISLAKPLSPLVRQWLDLLFLDLLTMNMAETLEDKVI